MGIEAGKSRENNISRRRLLVGGAVGVLALTGFPLLKWFNERNLALEESIKEANYYLEGLESHIKKCQDELTEIQKILSNMIAGTSESLESIEALNDREKILEEVMLARQKDKNTFVQSKTAVTDLTLNITAFFKDQKNVEKKDAFKQWSKENFLKSKKRIETQMASLSEQYEKTDAEFEVLIVKLREQIQKGRSDLGYNTKNTNIA